MEEPRPSREELENAAYLRLETIEKALEAAKQNLESPSESELPRSAELRELHKGDADKIDDAAGEFAAALRAIADE